MIGKMKIRLMKTASAVTLALLALGSYEAYNNDGSYKVLYSGIALSTFVVSMELISLVPKAINSLIGRWLA